MASVSYGGSIRMNPEVKEETRDPMFDGGYPYSIPKVYLDGVGESYFPQWCFNWDNDSVVVVRDKHVVKYTKSVYLELLAKNEAGEIVWMDGRSAPYSNCWEGEYLNEDRGAQEYTVEEYDFEKFEKRKYKVILDETSKFDANNLHGIYGFLDSEVVGSDFIIVDGVLTKYIGESTNLIIPDGVTEIDYHPFVSVHDFEIISIPKTLTYIPSYIFKQCTTKSINVDKDNPRYYSKDGCLVDKESGTLIWAFAAKHIPDDNSIKKIGPCAFARREDLKRIVIPDSITEIGTEAFCECASLTSVVIADSTAIIGNDAFYGCKSLTKIKLPNTLEVVKTNTFSYCTSLASIEIPDSVQIVEHYAFYGCSSLSEIRTSSAGFDLSEVISGKSYVRNGDEWTTNITTNDTNHRSFEGFTF